MIGMFFEEMRRGIPARSRILYNQFRGDPAADIKGRWISRPLSSVDQLDPQANVYFTVSAMLPNSRGEYRRRKENFGGGVLLMIDDVGDGAGSKFPLSTISHLPPTLLIETSPDNHQAIYMFSEVITNEEVFDLLIKEFISKEFLGADPGMAGVNRVFRPPFGVNGKAKYEGWGVRGKDFNPKNRYTLDQIAAAFGLDLRPRVVIPRGATADRAENIRAFIGVRGALRAAGMLKKENADMAGWTDIRCPWVGNHTGGADNGAAIREPAEENQWYGGFKCFHGSCADKNWGDLTQWLSEEHGELLAAVNRNAKSWEEYAHD